MHDVWQVPHCAQGGHVGRRGAMPSQQLFAALCVNKHDFVLPPYDACLGVENVGHHDFFSYWHAQGAGAVPALNRAASSDTSVSALMASALEGDVQKVTVK